MNLPVPEKARVFEAGDEAQHAGLVTKFQMVLEADQIVGIGAQVFLAQLHYGIGRLADARIAEPDWLHGAEAQRISAASCDLLDRQAGFEVVQLFPVALFHGFRGEQRVIKTVVLVFRHGTVDVVRRALVIACRQVHLVHVDRFSLDDRADGIVEIEFVRG